MNKIIQAIYSQIRDDYDTVILQRAHRILNNDNIVELEYDATQRVFNALVQSESYYDDEYEVVLRYIQTKNRFDISCDCPYEDNCKHEAAVLLKIAEQFSSGIISWDINPSNCTNDFPDFTNASIKEITGEQVLKKALSLEKKVKVDGKLIAPGHYKCSIQHGAVEHKVVFKNERNTHTIHSSCNCSDTENSLCIHKVLACFNLFEEYGKYGLLFTHDYSKEILKILSGMGLSRDDDYNQIITFYFENNGLTAEVSSNAFISSDENYVIRDYIKENPLSGLKELMQEEIITGYAILFKHNYYRNSSITVSALTGKKAKKSDKMIDKPDVSNLPLENDEWRRLADNNDFDIARLLPEMEDLHFKSSTNEYLHTALANFKKFFRLASGKRVFTGQHVSYYHDLKAAELNPVRLSENFLKTSIKCIPVGSFIKLQMSYKVAGKNFKIKNTYDESSFIIDKNDELYLWNSVHDYKAFVISSGEKELLILKSNWGEVWQSWLKDLANRIHVDIQKDIMKMKEIEPGTQQRKVFLKEEGNFLLLYPAIAYENVDVHVLQAGEQYYSENNEKVNRDSNAERELIQVVASTHESFNEDTLQPFFYMQADKVLEKMWFINFYETCKKEAIEVFGIEKLQKVKYYPARPKVNYSFSSGTDWFDINVSLQYDNYTVTLKDVRKALLKKNDYVKLDNDKFAMLPEEWLEKFSGAIRFGKISDDGIRLKKNQFALVHELYDDINDLELQKEFAEKRALLNGSNGIEKIRKPKIITAKLRDYQAEGLNWLGFLYKTGLGGCLADDMGLGKTLQMLSLYAYAKGQNPGKKLTNLVVCPTSLIFNWKNEIEKFAPSLEVKIHWGNNRDNNSKE
ncbi:MAG: DEAD/DEAH box helicase [Bacteroidales bacterium]|nr:DEAD/DEAH box helicase [Bacteroidales bacterium]